MTGSPNKLVVIGSLLASMALACQDKTIATSFVEPALGNACLHLECGEHGSCTLAETGDPRCSCTTGFTGDRCQFCAASFHRDAKGHCVPDRFCAEQPEDPCGSHGKCDDHEGVIACDCDIGYEGPRCELCASSYGRDRYDDCLLLTLSGGNAGSPGLGPLLGAGGQGPLSNTDGGAPPQTNPPPISDGPCVTGELGFDDAVGFPTTSNTCLSSAGTMALGGMSLTSTGGAGTVWKCAANTFYRLDSNHVALELSPGASAGLEFHSAITALSFDWAARLGAVSTSVLADGKVIASLAQPENGKTAVAFTFSTPITHIEFRDLSAVNAQIAIDNISYEAAGCSR